MKERIMEPSYEIDLTLQERLALSAIVQHDGSEKEIAEKAAEHIPEQLDITKEEFTATIMSLVTQLSETQLRNKPPETE